MRKTIEDYQNIVELMKKALEFYADNNNYHGGMGNIALIDADERGSQARFALFKLRNFSDERDEQEKDFVKNIVNAIEGGESEENILNLINTYKTETEKNGNV